MNISIYFLHTLGPLNKTTVDFLCLVWQERPPIIVMVTNLKEDKKNKCQQYWPESGSTQIYGPFQVTLADEQVYTDYTIRTLQLAVRRTSFIDHTQLSHYMNSSLTTKYILQKCIIISHDGLYNKNKIH